MSLGRDVRSPMNLNRAAATSHSTKLVAATSERSDIVIPQAIPNPIPQPVPGREATLQIRSVAARGPQPTSRAMGAHKGVSRRLARGGRRFRQASHSTGSTTKQTKAKISFRSTGLSRLLIFWQTGPPRTGHTARALRTAGFPKAVVP
jgi:hypothetical protein